MYVSKSCIKTPLTIKNGVFWSKMNFWDFSALKIFIFNFVISFLCISYELYLLPTTSNIGLSIYAIRLAKECTGWKLETKWEKCLGPYRWKFLYVQSARRLGTLFLKLNFWPKARNLVKSNSIIYLWKYLLKIIYFNLSVILYPWIRIYRNFPA